MPAAPHYQLLAASAAVRQSLVAAGRPVAQAPVVYPGARCELFGPQPTGRPSAVASALALHAAGVPWGTPANPLKLGFAGLLMGSKGAHTVVEALIAALTRSGARHGAGFEAEPHAFAVEPPTVGTGSAGLGDLAEAPGAAS